MAESPHYKELLHILNELEVEDLIVGGYAVVAECRSARAYSG
jgi:hypothetical protein